jgi:hypothetical protein
LKPAFFNNTRLNDHIVARKRANFNIAFLALILEQLFAGILAAFLTILRVTEGKRCNAACFCEILELHEIPIFLEARAIIMIS